MEHRPLVDLQTLANLGPAEPRLAMSRAERLQRWIELLEREPTRRLNSLREIEYAPPKLRRTIRGDNSALTVAYEDLALRAEGLGGDTLGDAMDFFELSERDAHTALCSCHFGSTVEARVVAARVRDVLSGRPRWGFLR